MNATRIVRWILPALLLTFVSTVGPTLTPAQIAITVTVAPPALPVYEQPPCPEEGWMWVPGYWAWGEEDGYYWVPGEWVPAPYTGALWTPPWWGWKTAGIDSMKGIGEMTSGTMAASIMDTATWERDSSGASGETEDSLITPQ